MKILVIGDIHGRENWKEIISSNKDSVEKIVIMGDYFDPYESREITDMIRNFNEILDLKKAEPDKYILLLGNHDTHYFCPEACTSTRFSHSGARFYESLFKDNLKYLDYIWKYKNTIFSHAGISKGWFKTSFPGIEPEDAYTVIKSAGLENRDLHNVGWERGGHGYGGIFWADFQETTRSPLPGWNQVIAHSRTSDIVEYNKEYPDREKLYFCDCLEFGKYLILDL